MASELARNIGATLDEQSTLAATDATLESTEKRVANLSGNLVSRSGYDAGPDLAALDIGFVVVADAAGGDGDPVRTRALDALNNNALLSPVGHTANGMLWRVLDVPEQAPQLQPQDTGERLGTGILIGQGTIFALTLLLGIPTARRRKRRVLVSGSRPQQADARAGSARTAPGEHGAEGIRRRRNRRRRIQRRGNQRRGNQRRGSNSWLSGPTIRIRRPTASRSWSPRSRASAAT